MRFRAKTMATGWENHGNGRAERVPRLLWAMWRGWRVARVCGPVCAWCVGSERTVSAPGTQTVPGR